MYVFRNQFSPVQTTSYTDWSCHIIEREYTAVQIPHKNTGWACKVVWTGVF